MLGVKPRGGGRALLLSVLVIILLLIPAYAVYDLNGHSLDFSDREIVLVVTGSMDAGETDNEISTIPVDSLVMVEHLDQDGISELKIGDVIAFDDGKLLIVHRIVGFENGNIITKGDANKSTETVDPDDVVGKVVGVSHVLGQITAFVKSGDVILVLMGLCVVVILLSIWDLLRLMFGKEGSG